MKTSIITWQRWNGRAPGSIGSSVMRGDWLVAAAPEKFMHWTHGMPFDGLIVQKVYKPELFDDFKGPSILDLCDPDWLGASVDIAEVMQHAGAITVSSQGLYDTLHGYTDRPMYIVPDRMHYGLLPKPATVRMERAKQVVWFGYKQNIRDSLALVMDSLHDLGLDLTVISNQEFEPSNRRGVHIKNITWDPMTAYHAIQNCDMVLNYQPNFGKYTYKSTNKTALGYALGLPVAVTAEDVERLLDPAERVKDVAEWNAKHRETYNIQRSVEQYTDILNKLRDRL